VVASYNPAAPVPAPSPADMIVNVGGNLPPK
jgi:hypothetical protein